jgi:hypothetical protein
MPVPAGLAVAAWLLSPRLVVPGARLVQWVNADRLESVHDSTAADDLELPKCRSVSANCSGRYRPGLVITSRRTADGWDAYVAILRESSVLVTSEKSTALHPVRDDRWSRSTVALPDPATAAGWMPDGAQKPLTSGVRHLRLAQRQSHAFLCGEGAAREVHHQGQIPQGRRDHPSRSCNGSCYEILLTGALRAPSRGPDCQQS